MQKLDYSFIREHKGSNITLFINGQNSWIGEDMDISISNKQLKVIINNTQYLSDILVEPLINQLLYSFTNVVLVNEKLQFISNYSLPPLKD